MPLSHAPLKTYSHRRTRGQTVVGRVPPKTQSSSPLKDLEDQDDITLTEMSKRMAKRSRNPSNSQQFPARQDATQRLAKKLKAHADPELLDASRDSPEMPVANTVFPLQNQDVNETHFQTPRPSVSMESSMPVSTADTMLPEQFSPLPAARRILSRTSSRNLKENADRMLCSPFSSRPGSRGSSPLKRFAGHGKRPGLHAKSRTLSSSILQKSTSIAISSMHKDTRSPDRHVGTVPLLDTQQTTSHTRTASIPTISTSVSDEMSHNDWLIPAKALSRSPLASLEGPDEIQASFYFDIPNHISTPAKKKRAEIVPRIQRRSIYSDDSDIDIPDSDESPLDRKREEAKRTLPMPGSPRQLGRRRRTIMHVSRDSLFSSSLDFSAYVTDDEFPNHIRRAQGEHSLRGVSRVSDSANLGIDLAEAFSPEPSLSPLRPSVGALPTPLPSPRQHVLSSSSASKLSCSGKNRTSDSSPGDDELRDMFSVLELHGMFLCILSPPSTKYIVPNFACRREVTL